MKVAKLTLTVLIVFFIHPLAYAENTWSLEDCIQHALSNNLDVKEQQLEIARLESGLAQERESRYPTLNLQGGHNYNFGRTLDQFTNEFATQGVHSNNFRLNANVTLFEGFRKQNTIERHQIDTRAGREAKKQREWIVTTDVIQAYLEVVMAEEMLKIREEQLELTQQDLEITEKRIASGELTEGDRLQIEAEVARLELENINARNNLQLSYLRLRHILYLPSEENFAIESPENIPASDTEIPGTDEVYQTAREHYPGFRQRELQIHSAMKEKDIARSGRYPSLNLHANIGTGFSGARVEPDGEPVFTGMQQIGVTSDGETVFQPQYRFDTRTVPFTDQLDNNFNQTVGITFSMPLYDNRRVKYQSNQAEISRSIAENRLTQMEYQLRNEIEQMHADAVAASRKYEAAQTAYRARERSFENIRKRFELGMMSTYEFNEASASMFEARSEMMQARYEYYFKRQILGLYLGEIPGI